MPHQWVAFLQEIPKHGYRLSFRIANAHELWKMGPFFKCLTAERACRHKQLTAEHACIHKRLTAERACRRASGAYWI